MIHIGLTGWGDHPTLMPNATRNKLAAYAGHFPLVEVDSSFYALQSTRQYEKWTADTPAAFSFLVKAYQGMTGHQRGEIPFATPEAMFAAFRQMIEPMVAADKLFAVLFQYPPWFDCTRENVNTLRQAREWIGELPVVLEFRHQSWFAPTMIERTLSFMERERWIHGIADEPQAGLGSVPLVLRVTDKQKALVRLHGRNRDGWTNRTGDDEHWRKVRYLYRYSERELLEWKEHLLALQKDTQEIGVVFNNNSGGDAADNAKQLMEHLGIEYEGLAARQINLFEL